MLRAMFGSAPRLARWLLWLAIALLPLRGFAAAVMPMAMGAPGGQGEAAVATAVAVMPPCHGLAVDMAAAVDDDDATPSACSMCAVCHGSVAQAPAAPALPAAAPSPCPDAEASSPIEPRAPDALFRPPRSELA
jgi:hypothetical protein